MMKNIRERSMLGSTLACIAMLVAVQVARGEEQQPQLVEAGTLKIDQIQAARFLSGNGSSGTLTFQGKSYPVNMSVGAVGISKIVPVGTVYNITDAGQLAGTYTQAPWSYALADGKLWLEKAGESNVVIRFDGKPNEPAPALNGSLVRIQVR